MKETKIKEKPSRDPIFDQFDHLEAANSNALTLPAQLKEYFKEQGLDFRFLNSAEYRKNGNFHSSDWRAYKINDAVKALGIVASPEGLIVRGDLILGVRPKRFSEVHKKRLAEKNLRYSAFNKEAAKELRKQFRDAGVDESNAKVHEGYDDNE